MYGLTDYKLDINQIKKQAFGKWALILLANGMSEDFLHLKKRVPCPICGGTDRYTFVDKTPNQTCYCSKCNIGGDGINMLSKFLDISFYDALKLVNDTLNGEKIKKYTPPKRILSSDVKIISENQIKAYHKMIDSVAPLPTITATNYYERRGIKSMGGKILDGLLYGNIGYWDIEKKVIRDKKGIYIQSPAIVALMSQFSAKPVGAMQIYLQPEQIAPYVEKVEHKKFFNTSPAGLVGTGVWLTNKKTKVLHAAEGLENLLSVCYSLGTRAGVCTGTRALLAGLIIPSHIQELHIWSDSDKNGVIDANKLRARHEKDIRVIVHTPPDRKDWNDVLKNDGKNKILKAAR